MEFVDPFGWHALEAGDFERVKRGITSFESMTWAEILGRRHHAIARHKLCKEAQDRLEALGLDDVERFVSLALGNLPRVWGYREGSVLLLLWWDPLHLICPANQRNT